MHLKDVEIVNEKEKIMNEIEYTTEDKNCFDRNEILSVIEKYEKALDLLDDYDHQTMKKPKGEKSIYVLKYEECRAVIQCMRFGKESDLFGKEKAAISNFVF